MDISQYNHCSPLLLEFRYLYKSNGIIGCIQPIIIHQPKTLINKRVTIISVSNFNEKTEGNVTRKSTSNKTREMVLNFDLLSEPGPLMRRSHQRTREMYNSLLTSSGMSRPVISLLISIYQNPNTTYTKLSKFSGLDRCTLGEMIDRLVKTELVIRNKSPQDGRAYAVVLTERGKVLIESNIEKVLNVQQLILDPLPEALRPVFVQCLKILLNLEEEEI